MDTEEKPRRRGWLRALLVGAVLVTALFAVLAGWNKLVASPSFCGTCHAMDAARASAARSVHSNVPCIACHQAPGLVGSLRYVPTLARETVAEATGWNVAGGVLKAGACQTCHPEVQASPAPGSTHPAATTSQCASCHGDTSHAVTPRPVSPLTMPHPSGWIQMHGAQVAQHPNSCNTCHQPDFCTACHFRTQYPHPMDWIKQHGLVEESKGIKACSLCHPSSFCVGCHGTVIPHPSDWLGTHWQAMQSQSAQPCYTCHPVSDCNTCHAQHAIHNAQTIYARPGVGGG